MHSSQTLFIKELIVRPVHQILFVAVSLVAIVYAPAQAFGAEDVARPPSDSSAKNPSPRGSSAQAQGGTGAESQSPHTGAPGRTGSAATAKGTPSRDPTASRGKKEEAPAASGGTSARQDATGSRTDRPGGLTGQSVGESVGKPVPDRPTQK
jgi:hypothetical protein